MKIRKFSIRESLCARNVQFAHSRKYMRAKVSLAKVSSCESFFTQGNIIIDITIVHSILSIMGLHNPECFRSGALSR